MYYTKPEHWHNMAGVVKTEPVGMCLQCNSSSSSHLHMLLMITNDEKHHPQPETQHGVQLAHCKMGRLRSIQGLPSAMPHGMAETPHGIEFSVLFF